MQIKFEKAGLGYFILAAALGFAFTVVIYNLRPIMNVLDFLYEQRILIHISVTFFYFWLFLFLRKRVKWSNLLLILFCVATPLVVDASVLVTNPSLVPLRFPFSSIFPILGATLGYVKVNKTRFSFWGYLFGIIAFFAVTGFYILPKLYYDRFQKDPPLGIHLSEIFLNKFLASDSGNFVLKDSVKAKVVLVEYYFIGCGACKEKEKYLRRLAAQFKSNEFEVVSICDGSITPFPKYLKGLDTESNWGKFYYDGDSVINKLVAQPQYPMEMLFYKGKFVDQLIGFNEATMGEEYYKDRMKKIAGYLRE